MQLKSKKDIVIFGAGSKGMQAAKVFGGYKVAYFVDNAADKVGRLLMDIPVISFLKFQSMKPEQYQLILAVSSAYQNQIKEQIEQAGILEYEVFNYERDSIRERIISYCRKENGEDIILYHVLREIDNIFYIDVGSNDPFKSSVTKTLYDSKNARGINIEPQRKLYEIAKYERPRDINMCLALGSKPGMTELFFQGELSTTVKENVLNKDYYSETIEVMTLKQIFEKYIKNREVSFLKIDVEGAEAEVLKGADFSKCRPWIIIVEATIPLTEKENYEEWEYILLSSGYCFVQMIGANRYYLANEKRNELGERFETLEKLADIYEVYYATIY